MYLCLFAVSLYLCLSVLVFVCTTLCTCVCLQLTVDGEAESFQETRKNRIVEKKNSSSVVLVEKSIL